MKRQKVVYGNWYKSITHFLLMTNRQNRNEFAIKAVTSHITAVAKANRPFSMLF